MRAITVWQPWASLIALRVKWIETRGNYRPWSAAIGETVGIHAAKRPVPEKIILGQWEAWPADPARGPFHPNHPEGPRPNRLYDNGQGLLGAGSWLPLPLGALVATAKLVDILPISPRWSAAHLRAKGEKRGRSLLTRDHRIFGGDSDGLWVVSSDGGRGEKDGYAEDQLPFGDFTEGRWGLMLDNVVPCVPVPCRGSQGLWTVPPEIADNLLGYAA